MGARTQPGAGTARRAVQLRARTRAERPATFDIVTATDLPYPAHWEADVVLRDGGTAVLRPIRPDDAARLVAFYARVSDESKYLRFFAPYPRLSERDVDRFTHVDHRDRVAFIVTVGEGMIAVGRYDRSGEGEAEVAFLVQDADQGRGVGSVLLEHLAQAARENGLARFVAEVLPENDRMAAVFREAGYQVAGATEDGVTRFELAMEPTAMSLEVMAAREHRAEARSVERLLTPGSVAVVGASRSADKVGQTLVRNLVLGGFTGPVYAVNRAARAVAGVPAYPSLLDIPGDVDLAVVAVPAEAVHDVVVECAAKNVHGLVVVSSGFAETGREGRDRQRALARLARAHGLRVIGPSALGIINTAPEQSLNASLARVVPARGPVGFFCQSGELGTVILQTLAGRGLGPVHLCLGGQPGGRVRQRPVAVLGRGPVDGGRPALPGVDREPAQVQPGGAPAGDRQADRRDAVRAVHAGRAGRPHGASHVGTAGSGGRDVPAGRRHARRHPRRHAGCRAGAGLPAAAGRS